jgi:signal transduction histidine kinase
MRRAELLAISIEDEGIGIASEDQDKLFTKFYRVDSSLTREVGGTGLGLAIVKSYVEMHGGRVWVDSPLESATRRGSRFTFTVPLMEQTGLELPR